MEFIKTDNPEPITVNGVEVMPDESYDVDVDEDGPFITLAYYPSDEAREAALMDIMADELADEKMVEMAYENGVEPEIYA
jgi:hypothetical protein